MQKKYKDTLFDPSNKIDIPLKHSENKEFFIKINFQNIGYLSFQTFFFLLFYYMILGFFWFNLYDKHFWIVTIGIILNVSLSLILLVRDKQSGKNMIDMLVIIYRYMRKKNLYILKANKNDLFSLNQKDTIN